MIHGVEVKGGGGTYGADTIVNKAWLELYPVIREVAADRDGYERVMGVIYHTLYRVIWHAVGLPITWNPPPPLPEEG